MLIHSREMITFLFNIHFGTIWLYL